MKKLLWVVLVSLFVGQLVTLKCEAQTIIWQYKAKGFDLYNPSFSWNGKEIAFSRQRHTPDGVEAEAYSEKALDEIANKNKTIVHFGDPEVIIADVGTDHFQEVDWGWTPCFSEDGRNLAYSKQVKSLSGLRILAATLAGNTINLFDLRTGTIKVLVSPDDGLNLRAPMFSADDQKVFYVLSGAVNGDWQGNIGVGVVDLETGKSKTLLESTGTYVKIFQTINYPEVLGSDPIVFGQDCFVTNSPDKTLINLTRDKKILYSMTDPNESFCPTSDGAILIYDNGWKRIDGNTGKVLESFGEKDAAFKGVISPDGKKVMGFQNNTDSLYEAQNGKNELLFATIGKAWEKTLLKTDGFFYELVWSKDSKEVAVVIGHNKPNSLLHDYDELLIIKIDKPI